MLNKRINLATQGRHGATIIFRNTVPLDTSYQFDVEDNSHDYYPGNFLG